MTSLIKVTQLKRAEGLDLYFNRQFSLIMNYDWLLSGAALGDENTRKIGLNPFLFMDSDLHRSLNLVAGKQLAQVEGKYKKARLYIFETEGLYIAAVCETGDKGSGWYFLDKDNTNPSKGYSSSEDIYNLAPSKIKELSNFMMEMLDFLKKSEAVLKKEEPKLKKKSI